MTDNPTTFDLDEWLADAHRPQRAVRVHGRADLIARLDELDRMIKVEQKVTERAVGDQTLASLEREWEQVAEQFHASALEITVQALNSTDIKAVEDEVLALDGLPPKAKAKRREDATADEQDRVGEALLAKAIVDPPMSVEQVRKLKDRIGEPQLLRLVQAWRMAGTKDFEVSAPFSRASSTQGDGDSA